MDVTIRSSYDIIKKYYDSVLNVDSSLVKTSNDEPTPISCVEEMISSIPRDTWKNPSLKILDPCCGCGNFFLVVFKKLREYHSEKHILENMLYWNDLNEDRLNVVKRVFCGDEYSLNITEKDYLEYDCEERFDMVLANPPYAKILSNGRRASKNHNLIGKFIEKSLSILQRNGYLLFITPDNWMSYSDRNILITRLTSLQIHHLNIHLAKRYFPKVGSSFAWYLIENTPSYKDIYVEGVCNGRRYSGNVRSQVRRFIPLYYTQMIQDILKKTIDTEGEKFKIETSSDLHKYTKRDLISTSESESHPYKLIHTPKQTVWASRPHKYQSGFKVFISLTSYYGVFVDECGMTQSIAFIRVDSEEEAMNIKHVLEHPLYKMLNNICRYGNFNNVRVLQGFPYHTDYDTVYEKFGITGEEIEFIESL